MRAQDTKNFNIEMKLFAPFVDKLNYLRNKYPESFTKMNGLHEDNLNFTTFISNFIEEKSVADASIDGNANARTKDICSLEAEMSKPHKKLLSLHKIYYEMFKKYGRNIADSWLEDEWNGAFYLHDAYSASQKPYCFSGSTKFITKNGTKRLDEMCGKEVLVFNKNREWERAVIKEFGEQELVKITLRRKGLEVTIDTTKNHRWFTINSNKSIDVVKTIELRVGSIIPFNSPEEVSNANFEVVDIMFLGETEKVYCAVTENTHSFTLEHNILTHNCFAYSLEDMVNKGLFFVNDFKSEAPKHLLTYTRDVLEFVSWTSNRSSGACGLPDFLIYHYYFWYKDVSENYYLRTPEYYRNQGFQEIIYGLNQPYLRVNQSAFTNFTIMDRYYLIELFGGKKFPDGSPIIDHIDNLLEYQLAFLEEVARTRRKSMFTFPVLTFSLLKKKEIDFDRVGDYDYSVFVDEEYARKCSKHNMEWADSNFFSSDDITSLSSCCFDGSQKVLTRSSKGVSYLTLKELFESPFNDTKLNFSVFHNGSWVNAKQVKIPYGGKIFEVKTKNNKSLKMTHNHLVPTLTGDKEAHLLTTNDYILFNTGELQGIKNCNLDYSDGFVLGMYLGDGSTYTHKNCHSKKVIFSLNKEKYKKCVPHLKKVLERFNFTYNGKYTCYNNCYSIAISNKELFDFVKEFVTGDYCYEKGLNLDVLLYSSNFRRGILDGIYTTDGGNSNRIYTTSSLLAEHLEVLITSLGLNSTISVSDRTDKKCSIRGIDYSRNYPLYCVRWYTPNNRRKQGDILIKRNNSIYFKVDSITSYTPSEEYVYCFEMKNLEEPYFTLPNGVITHNCRLINDFSKLNGFINSIGGTQLKIGSVKVNTINLARIALESKKDKDKFFEILEKRVDLCVKVLDCVRHIIKRNVEKGLLPNYQYKLIELEHQYNTIGINGMFEAVRYMNGVEKDEVGNYSYTSDGLSFAERILDKINEQKDSYDFDYSINVEAVPAERCAVILLAKDKELFLDEVQSKYLYGNQWIPLDENCTVSEKVRLGATLDKKCGGGQIMHLNISGDFVSEEQAWNILNKVVASGVIYFAFNKKINVCEKGHGFFGEVCSECGGDKVDEVIRVVGFLTPKSSFSKMRKEEMSRRYFYELEDGLF